MKAVVNTSQPDWTISGMMGVFFFLLGKTLIFMVFYSESSPVVTLISKLPGCSVYLIEDCLSMTQLSGN